MLLLIQRKFLNEVLLQFLKTLGAILLLLGVILLIRFLNQANEGKISSLKILAILGYTLIQYSPPLLVGSFFIGLVSIFGRMQQDSEVVIWQQMNVYRWKWWKYLLIVSLPLMGVQYFLMNFFTPWAIQKNHQMIQETQTNSTFAQLQTHKFQKIGPATLYIEDLDIEKKQLKKPFFHWNNTENIHKNQNKEEEKTTERINNQESLNSSKNSNTVNSTAPELQQEKAIFATNGEFQGRTLWLKNGIYQAKTESKESEKSDKTIFDYVTFKKFGVFLPEDQADQVEQLKSYKAKYGFSLNSFLINKFNIQNPFHQTKYVLTWKKNEEKAEQFWRYSLILFLLILPCLAWRMSNVPVRKRNSSNYLTALLYFMLYLNITGVIQQQILKHRISLEIAFGLHLLFVLLIIYLPQFNFNFSFNLNLKNKFNWLKFKK